MRKIMRRDRKYVACTVSLALLSTTTACRSRDSQNDILNAPNHQSQKNNVSTEALSKWNQFQQATLLSDIQTQCRPVHTPAAKNTSFQGYVILFHGFSACPQQYEELIPRLTAAGFEVFAPLYPGHGVVPESISPRLDNTMGVPNSETAWEVFVTDVIQFAESLHGGKKILIGLSHGANIALRAIQRAPETYDRAILIAPKLKTEASQFTGLFTNQVSLFNIDNFIAEKRSGWKKCEEDAAREPVGRGGFCNMENRKAIAMLDFGKLVIKGSAVSAGDQAPSTKTQVILSTEDDGIANNTARNVFMNMRASAQTVSVCQMPKGIPHSMFSKYDFPYEKPWVDELFDGIIDFTLAGTAYPGSSSEGEGTCSIRFSPSQLN